MTKTITQAQKDSDKEMGSSTTVDLLLYIIIIIGLNDD